MFVNIQLTIRSSDFVVWAAKRKRQPAKDPEGSTGMTPAQLDRLYPRAPSMEADLRAAT